MVFVPFVHNFRSKVDKDGVLLKAAAITANIHTMGTTGAGNMKLIY